MADEERDINETNTWGTDWEVVSLTASAYAAASGPQRFDPEEQHKNQEFSKSEQDYSEAMFMSKHFVFPQEPEYVPSDHYRGKIHKNYLDDEKFSEPQKFNKDKGKIDPSELFDTGHSFSDHSMDFGDGKQEDLKIVEKEHDLFVAPIYSNLDEEAFMSSPLVYEDISELAETRNPSPEKPDYPSWRSHSCEPHEEENNEKCDESHEAWWKKRAMSVYNHAKGTNAFWSIFVAVAMAGFVILGQRWRREKTYFQQFKWKFSGPDEKINRMAGPVSRLKVLVGGNHRGGSMREGLHPTF